MRPIATYVQHRDREISDYRSRTSYGYDPIEWNRDWHPPRPRKLLAASFAFGFAAGVILLLLLKGL